MYNADVSIVLTRPGKQMEVHLHRRSRKGFRDRLMAMEGTMGRHEGLMTLPIGWLDEAQKVIAEEYPGWRVHVEDERPKQHRPGDRVSWAWLSGGFGGKQYTGFVGQMKVFSISHTGVPQEDGSRKYMECLFTELPGFGGNQYWGIAQCESREAAEKKAEDVLKHFVARLGAEFKED